MGEKKTINYTSVSLLDYTKIQKTISIIKNEAGNKKNRVFKIEIKMAYLKKILVIMEIQRKIILRI